jgi:putative lumazine-binding protein
VTSAPYSSLVRASIVSGTATSHLPAPEMFRLAFTVLVSASLVAATAGKDEQGTLEIVSVDVTGTAALVKVMETYATSVYIDYLNLLRIGQEWRIVNKIYMSRPR